MQATTEDQAPTEVITSKLDNWWDIFVSNLPNLAIALSVVVVAYLLSKLFYRITLKLTYKHIKQTSVSQLIARISSTVVVLGGLFLALGALNLGKTLTTMLSAAGISGLVIGLALQGTLSNLISGIVLSFRKNIRIGNWIESNNYTGEVIDINLNYFVLKEADNNVVVLPNKKVLENPFKNYSLTNKMRVTINCGVGYDSDLELVKYLTQQTISNRFEQDELEEEIEFYYTEYGDSAIQFICRFWIPGKSGIERLKAKSEAIMAIKKEFDKEGITIPYPIRTLDIPSPLSLKNIGKSETLQKN